MYCKFCGAPLPLGSKACAECKRGQDEPYDVSATGKKGTLNACRFWRRNYHGKWSVWLAALLCFGIAVWVFFIGRNDPMIGLFSLFDVAVLAGCGFMILHFRTRIFAVILAAYAVYTSVVAFTGNAFRSWEVLLRLALVVLAAVLGVYGTFRFHCRFKRIRREYRLRFPGGKAKRSEEDEPAGDDTDEEDGEE